MRKKRYLEKLETFENELEFIKTHSMDSEATKRACLYSLQICVDVVLDGGYGGQRPGTGSGR